MKKLLLLLLISCATLIATATDYPYLVIRQLDGSETYVKSNGLSFKISDGQLTTTHTDGNSTFVFSNLESMQFSATPAGITSISANGTDPVELYTTSGVFIGKFTSIDAAQRKITSSGVYLIKQKDKTAKMLIQK